MTSIFELSEIDEVGVEKLTSILTSVDNIEDYLNKPKFRRFSKSLTSISSIMRKIRNQSALPFDPISTVCKHTDAIKKEVYILKSIIQEHKAILESVNEQSNSAIESMREQSEIALNAIQKIWEAKITHRYIVLFMAPFYNETTLKDGYFRRIKAIDEIMGINCLKVYVTPANYMPEIGSHQSFPDDSHLDLKLTYENPEQAKFLHLIAGMSDLIYYHSIAFVNDITLNMEKTQILDLHGCVPEEWAFQGYPENAKLEDAKEKKAIDNVDYVIVVSKAMARHLQEKYHGVDLRYITMPILDDLITQVNHNNEPKPYKDDKPEIVYVGGLQKWQMIPRMQSLIDKTHHLYNYQILVPSPSDFLLHWKDSEIPDINAFSGGRLEVKKMCEKAHYGLLLREDIIVNRVSCPTKLVEYLAYGVVPVLISTSVGDFNDLGMKSISLDDLEFGKLPTEEERLKLVKENYECLDKLKKLYTKGKSELLTIFSSEV